MDNKLLKVIGHKYYKETKSVACPTLASGSQGNGDAVGGIDGEGQAPGEMAGLLYQIMFMAPMHCCLEVCIECAAIQLHQIQDGSCQGFHDLLCEREGSEGKVMRPKRAPSCCHGTG